MAKEFKKGYDERLNLKGRPKNSLNKIGSDLRSDITDFLTENFDTIKKDFAALRSPRDRIKLFIDLLQYGLPRLQAVELTDDLDRLSDEQIDVLYDKILKLYNYGIEKTSDQASA